MTLTQKLFVTGIFLIGLVTIGASIARIVAYLPVDATSKDPEEDIFLAMTITHYWPMLEAGLAYIASQLPTLSQYLIHFSAFKITSLLKSAISWVSFGSLMSRNHHDTAFTADYDRLQELRNDVKAEQPRQGSDETEWSESSQPKIFKVKGSETSLLLSHVV